MNLLPATTLSGDNRIHHGNALSVLRKLPSGSVQTIVTSPPYFGLRDYGVDGQIGLEQTPQEYVAALVAVFREARRVLRDDGTLWLNLGDSYSADRGYQVPDNKHKDVGNNGSMSSKLIGLPSKNLIGIPWRTAFALQDDGWILRSDIIWAKPNPMPESVTDRPTKAHEYIFLFAKSPRYYYDAEAVAEPSIYPGDNRAARRDTRKLIDPKCIDNGSRLRTGQPTGLTRNRRTVWNVATHPFKGAHFATFPPKLIEPCILAGCPAGGVVLDPFFGSGTTGAVAIEHGRHYVGIELNAEYIDIANGRLQIARERVRKAQTEARQLELIT